MSQLGGFVPGDYKSRLTAFMDVVRFGPVALPGAAFLALLFHVERSLPYGKASDTTSLGQMTNGIQRSDGSWVRAGSGLKKSAVAQANADLEKKGLLKRETRQSSRGGNRPTEYTVDWKALKAFFANVCNGADILRRCPVCVRDSIVGHGRRRKQAHDEHHDWIGIRRGLCNRCGKTFTFLPPF
jgi:hypothetical protein